MRLVLALAAWIGCYAPSARPGAPCPDGVCPEGLTCSPASQTCELRAIDASVEPADALVDAVPDAPADAGDAAVAPMLVQQVTNAVADTASVSATLPAAPTSGNVLVMIGATPSGGLTSVTGGGATWTRATASLENSNIEVWFGVTDGSSATVTIARTNNSTTMWLLVSEWSGLATAATLDEATSVQGTGSPISAGSITTTNARDLVLFAASAYAPATYGVPSPGTWTALLPITTQTTTQSAWYRVVSATGTLAPQVTMTGTSWEAALVALRIAP